ncbi:tetratricopeptide repeat protein [Undibacterium sp. TS12]|uniref:tetratricopeptide repeat protein n=1 Tax=Undibacterium sp. TS12 TaxID=2908202 RepID=UPI001F4CCB4D|nr:tetratricopeptide repeat protein [Undibacterium sp. TS12]MCH8618794.1 tetratricopeptide repeat protein [Undibacterium sp. TS12]
MREVNKYFDDRALPQAKQVCLNIIRHFPRHPDALYALARISGDLNEYDEAIAYLKLAFQVMPHFPDNRKIAFGIFNKYLQARQYLQLEESALWLSKYLPRDGVVWDYIGVARIEQGKFPEAHLVLTRALELLPNNPHILTNMGNVLISLERCAEAVVYLEKALAIQPDMVVALNNLGNALRYIGRTEEAIEKISKAVSINPDLPYLYNNLGLAYRESSMYALAIEQYRHALRLQPDLVQVYPNLIDALRQNGQVQESIECGQHALSLTENIPEIWGAYGDTLREANHLDAAIEAYIKALSFKTDGQSSFNRKIYTNLLFCLNYHPDLTPEVIYNAYHEFDVRFAQPLKASWKKFDNERLPGKRLKVGYVTQAFYNHVCKYFLLPLIEGHDKQQVEVYAYANPPFEDEITHYYKKQIDHWVPTRDMTDDMLADRIRADGIDILVDVAGHTNGNRLPVFARKPAPVSLHWLEYGYTTGLSAIDYYLTDKPTITDDCAHLFSETVWCLDGPAYVYRPDTRRAELTPPPFEQTGVITFGSLSRSTRINHRVVRVWATILDAMPNSQLIINSGDFKDPQVQEEMASRFMRYGIDRSRLHIGFSSPSWEVLKHIDIGLDCFPHNSGTTLLESLYMGIPFISLADRPSVGRIGASILHAIGHEEWQAYTEQEYAEKAIILAHDLDQLRSLRTGLRQEMEQSLLMNEPAFARSVEKAYRQMWQIYCERPEE